jgi:hypothetical protein
MHHHGHINSGTAAPTSSTRRERLLDVAAEEPGRLESACATVGRELSRSRITLAVLLILDAVVSIVLVLAAYHFSFTEMVQKLLHERYFLDASLLDSLCISLARIIAVSTQSRAGWWCGFFAATLAVCKAVVYGHGTEAAAASATVLAAVALAVCELVACDRCIGVKRRLHALAKLYADAQAAAAGAGAGTGEAAAKGEDKIGALLKPRRSSLRGIWKILRPYFHPKGIVSKLRTGLTFFVMAGSKTCNLLAPLYIGRAAQQLSEGTVPYTALAAYCTLRFGSSALKEAQSLIYIRVKQHAFAEIAENTFRHLLGLSLDWHLRKKMGEVLRVMDRGIASADSVMNYLILFLLPSIVEFCVACVIFFVHFKSPDLSATAILSFVTYCVLTVQITQWRKKFRTGQNKQDNKYHELATDALINFETVKYFGNEEMEARVHAHPLSRPGPRSRARSCLSPPPPLPHVHRPSHLRWATSRLRSKSSRATTLAFRRASRCSTRRSSSTSS